MESLTIEQRNLIKENSGQPVRLIDPDTNEEYVLLQAEVYEQLRLSVTDLEPRSLYPALQRALKDEGWDDPQMDEYNQYG
jgi:hypothetical protein